jgi:hypothetical protein
VKATDGTDTDGDAGASVGAGAGAVSLVLSVVVIGRRAGTWWCVAGHASLVLGR